MLVLFSNHCPKCTVLEKKLNQKNIEFEISSDFDEIKELGFQFLPVLKVNGEYLDFMEAVNWINKKG